MVLNGFPGKVLIFNTATNILLKEIIIPSMQPALMDSFAMYA